MRLHFNFETKIVKKDKQYLWVAMSTRQATSTGDTVVK